MLKQSIDRVKLHICIAGAVGAWALFIMGWPVCARGAVPLDRLLVSKAVDCGADPYLAKWMLEEETLAGIPKELRGITLAKACRESRFNADARGDCWTGTCKAYGLLQFWPWAEKDKYNPLGGIDRSDPKAQVRTWLGLSARQLLSVTRWTSGPLDAPKVLRYCPRQWRDPVKRWLVAMVRTNRRPRDSEGHHRCRERPKAWVLLNMWRG